MVTRSRGAKVVNLQRERERRLAEQLAPMLEGSYAVVLASSLDSVEEWRAAARIAGRVNGWRVRTGFTGDGERVWAVRDDLEPDEHDLRAAADRVSDLLFGPAPPKPAKPARSRRSTANLFCVP